MANTDPGDDDPIGTGRDPDGNDIPCINCEQPIRICRCACSN